MIQNPLIANDGGFPDLNVSAEVTADGKKIVWLIAPDGQETKLCEKQYCCGSPGFCRTELEVKDAKGIDRKVEIYTCAEVVSRYLQELQK